MEKSHLVHILRTLDKKEIRELKKWVASPAHNLRQDVVDLLEFLLSGNHLYNEKDLEKEKVFGAVYPDRTFSDSELRQVIHFLLKATEEYLLYNELFKDEVSSKTALAKVYRQRQLPRLFQKTIDSVQKLQEQQPRRNHQYYENEYALQFEQYSYLSGLSRTVPLNLQEVSDANDVAYLTNKLRLSCIMLSHQTVFKTEYKMGLLNDVLNRVEAEPAYLEIPAIAIYYFSFKAISEKTNKEFFQKLKEQILLHGDLFPTEEIRVIYLLAINYCIGRMNEGDSDFVNESYQLYKEGFGKNIFLENGILSRFTFGNAIMIALNLKEYQWAENFIKDFSDYLEEKHRDYNVHFYLARLHFEKKDYPKAMQLFVQADYDDILMTLVAKTMLLKMYFELDEYNALESLLGSMRTYLQRKKVMGYHKANYKNIIHFTKKLLKVTPYDKAQKEKLRLELAGTNPLTERKWLMEQLERM
ncbi:MAG: hypothetical protein H6577_07085 [Lewinellaceae bacterium]|nr:hypothetical protein [Saprospiraceae bacterium]MCB9337875.1 hypothetical protein [Lewinellaceae bacterium]